MSFSYHRRSIIQKMLVRCKLYECKCDLRAVLSSIVACAVFAFGFLFIFALQYLVKRVLYFGETACASPWRARVYLSGKLLTTAFKICLVSNKCCK